MKIKIGKYYDDKDIQFGFGITFCKFDWKISIILEFLFFYIEIFFREDNSK